MRGFLRLALILAPLLAACGTPMAWTKPGVTPLEAAQDSNYCRHAAWREAWATRRFDRFGAFGPGPTYDPYRRRWTYAQPTYGLGPGGDPFQEMRLQSFCMRAKGYALTPLAPSGG
ncbi:MAG: hypothetical protein HZC25_03965 [Rhodospirillales bacterium]|nr:hypothetical protein [Rhodospirillales bacterium]